MSYYLSKSRYVSGLQCPKILWLRKNKPEVFDDSVMNQAVLDTGSEVGDLAMGLFGDYTEVPYGDLSEMISETKKLLKKREKVICEASFSYNGLFCSVDILKNLGRKNVELYEVKSSTDIHDYYYDDVAFQYYVLKSLGYTVRKVCLVYINKEYVRHGDLDLQELLTIEDLTETAVASFDDVRDNIEILRSYVRKRKEEEKDISEDCFSPFLCGFFGYCGRHLPSPNVFDLSGVQRKTKLQYYKDGLVSFSDLEEAGCLKQNQAMQVDYELHDRNDHIEKKQIQKFLSELTYPLYFLDFESFQPAVPLYDDSKPYEQIPFQYSLHYMKRKNGKLYHKEFLAYPYTDPRRELAERLCADIPKDVCVLAYNMSFEKARIKRLAELYPDLSEHLMCIYDNIRDLMIPFQKRWYYTKAMQGSYSVKYVLPALYPDDPELDYHNLEGVHNGEEASSVFKQMMTMDKETLEEYRHHLLKYCQLDTYAMVKVLTRLWDC
ncbi:MAG: DUF2779 domain-containing protein [Solobacterium sp.]|nr:DUF2779 domain-containing protein [Solobacterium sp.]